MGYYRIRSTSGQYTSYWNAFLFELKVHLHIPSPSTSPLQLVKFTLTDIMGSKPNLSVNRSITIGTMVNFDGDDYGHGHGDGTCKRAYSLYSLHYLHTCANICMPLRVVVSITVCILCYILKTNSLNYIINGKGEFTFKIKTKSLQM